MHYSWSIPGSPRACSGWNRITVQAALPPPQLHLVAFHYPRAGQTCHQLPVRFHGFLRTRPPIASGSQRNRDLGRNTFELLAATGRSLAVSATIRPYP
ncbi:hypothetical protein BKA93DRAFT_782266 [Sparassis latifolia]